jgi:hypothetical protein
LDGFCEDLKLVVVEAGLTTWLTGDDVLPPKVESPAYTALTWSVPPPSVEIARVAEPALNGAVPSAVPADMNVTISPSGGVVPSFEVTTAVKLTACP